MDWYNRPIQKSDLEMDRYNSPIQKSDLETDRYNRPIQKSDLETDRYNRPIQKSELKIYRLCRPIQSEDRIGIGRSDNRTFRPPLLRASTVAALSVWVIFLLVSPPSVQWKETLFPCCCCQIAVFLLTYFILHFSLNKFIKYSSKSFHLLCKLNSHQCKSKSLTHSSRKHWQEKLFKLK